MAGICSVHQYHQVGCLICEASVQSEPARKRRELAERLLETFRVSYVDKTAKVPCGCVDLNGIAWPDCTCQHGWREQKRRDVEGTIAAIERVLEEEGK